MPVLSRVLGVATIATGVLEFAKPDLWAKPTGIVGPSPAMRTWHQTLGARDVLSGLAMTFAPAGPALRAATLFRIVSDVTDALAFGINAPERPAQGQGRRRRARLRGGQRRSRCAGPASDGRRRWPRPTAAVVGSGRRRADRRLPAAAHPRRHAVRDRRAGSAGTRTRTTSRRPDDRVVPDRQRLHRPQRAHLPEPAPALRRARRGHPAHRDEHVDHLRGLRARVRRGPRPVRAVRPAAPGRQPGLPADARRGQAVPRPRPAAARPRRRRHRGPTSTASPWARSSRSAATPATSSSTS